MKTKSVLLLIVGMLCCVSAYARDIYSEDVKVLPQPAQEALKVYFGGASVNHIKIDKDIIGVGGYEVVLDNGTEIEFDSKGYIKEVDASASCPVPDAVVMKPIREYVAQNYPNQKVVKYDVKLGGYEVELQSGLELVFNAQGAFRHIDR